MPRLKQQNPVQAQVATPQYSEACARFLNYSPEQFAAAVDSGVKPKLLTKEESDRLTPEENETMIHHVVELLAGYAKIKGFTEYVK